ncbi:transcriptional repressor [Coemansia sp. RSA 720]|nr:transcriptional repressor [Coemansia sp. RSA 638]KAJ2120506.1 transcriptional repressor [Coemansia sp. RSA 720]
MHFNSSPAVECHGSGRLGLWSTAEPAYSGERQPRSLSVRTAAGQRVSILNDDLPVECSASDWGSECGHSYAHSDSGLRLSMPLPSPQMTSNGQSFSLPSPQMTSIRLPSLSSLIGAVNISRHMSGTHTYGQDHVMCTYKSASPTYSQTNGQSQGKRKYKCTFDGCGKAFTTSGHLSRHFRIHTGEKNYQCLHPGCTSRFSRQDNMMQHYRTHLSPRSRRTRTVRATTTSGYSSVLAGYPVPVDTATGSTLAPYKHSVVQHSPPSAMQWSFF